MIDTNTFASYGALESTWNYLHPWGSDHNGTARMYASSGDHNHVYLESGGVLVIKASRIDWNEGNSSSPPWLPIRYHSGTVHSKMHVVINDQYPDWEVKGEFSAPSARGTWPAFWLTGVNSWPPESDILEFKGDNRNWFNTYDGGWARPVRGHLLQGPQHLRGPQQELVIGRTRASLTVLRSIMASRRRHRRRTATPSVDE
ncbi:family 16 glycosylhydrolase [Kribbella sp. NBC_01245]|uniref:hypothetical protein n=1 Tax=Kribbella sp. NBC_01245 TaxID=2903578 RepID=UPI002E2A8102|nr:hypothetical protein [Kribbella sp. NBC_01245]